MPRRSLVIVVAWGSILPSSAVAAPQGSIKDRRAALTRLVTELNMLDRQAGAAAVEQNAARDRVDEIAIRLERNTLALTRTRRQLSARRALLAARLSAIYRQPSPRLAVLLLARQGVSEIAVTEDMLARVATRDAELVVSVRQSAKRLAGLARTLDAERRERIRELRVAEARRAKLEQLVRRRRAVTDDARRDLKRLMAVERQRLARLAAEKQAREATRTSGAPYRAATFAASIPQDAGHVYPIAGASTFSDDWLAPRAGGRFHEGIDLFAARGTPAVAVADGRLFRVGWNRVGGWRLWLRDVAGTEFYYAHLEGYAPAAREGAFVEAGTVIGFVGDSGDARGTPPHVHFQIHPGGGAPTRPFPIVAGWPKPG